MLRFIIASLIDASAPSTSVARNDEPYSTKRPSPRRYQTRPGMNDPSGPRPVAKAERQTGVSDGKHDTAGECTVPCATSAAMVGARPSARARSNSGRPARR